MPAGTVLSMVIPLVPPDAVRAGIPFAPRFSKVLNPAVVVAPGVSAQEGWLMKAQLPKNVTVQSSMLPLLSMTWAPRLYPVGNNAKAGAVMVAESSPWFSHVTVPSVLVPPVVVPQVGAVPPDTPAVSTT